MNHEQDQQNEEEFVINAVIEVRDGFVYFDFKTQVTELRLDPAQAYAIADVLRDTADKALNREENQN